MNFIRLILYGVLIYLLYRLIKGLVISLMPGERGNGEETGKRHPVERIGEELVEDAWCHTYVPISTAVTYKENGRTLFFCSKACLQHYKNNRGGRE